MPLAFLRGTFWLLAILQLTAPQSDQVFTTGTIGHSVHQRPLQYYRIGTGPIPLVVIGTIHAGYEANTREAAKGLLRYFASQPDRLAPELSLYFIPNINPDGNQLDTRHNANEVDLNRNWDTPDWQEDIPGIWSMLTGEGGSAPFSEPETAALQEFLHAVQRDHPYHRTTAVFLHSLRMDPRSSTSIPKGLVQPAYRLIDDQRQLHGRSLQAADIFADAGSFIRIESWVGEYPTPGEAIHWAALHDIIAFDVEFPTAESLEPAHPGGNPYYSRFHTGMIRLMEELHRLAAFQPSTAAE
ncbi:M14 family metallopeptidase [Spirochaeta africana]|uniref:Putative carboxypeptidase n=1 Tax=Spirochaeta africana (strain ATCC 700263 / DSM 8902 / Z-7692) TaxID=889378 RepID=H9UI44_SPIAZ|nr:M14 family metallopeptidase [Spirochaeta africana]AFG37187.1 putative carboxypeptidase [Spirochaeta africana DSM 8902]